MQQDLSNSTPVSLMQQAFELAHGEKQETYGDPLEQATRLGRLFGAVLGIPDIPPLKVALLLECLKISREAGAEEPKDDTIVDGYGYWYFYERIAKALGKL